MAAILDHSLMGKGIKWKQYLIVQLEYIDVRNHHQSKTTWTSHRIVICYIATWTIIYHLQGISKETGTRHVSIVGPASQKVGQYSPSIVLIYCVCCLLWLYLYKLQNTMSPLFIMFIVFNCCRIHVTFPTKYFFSTIPEIFVEFLTR